MRLLLPLTMQAGALFILGIGGCHLGTSGFVLEHPYPNHEREFRTKFRLVDEVGQPLDCAEVWIDDGRTVSLMRILPDRYGIRLENGRWADTLYSQDRFFGPGEIGWSEVYDSAHPLPTMLRIIVLVDDRPVGSMARKLSASDTWAERRSVLVETIPIDRRATRRAVGTAPSPTH